MSEPGSTVPRRQLGRYLRDLRSQTGMTLHEVAQKAEISASTVQRYEHGRFPAKLRSADIRELCAVLGADETLTAALEGLAQQANAQNWWHEYDDVIPQDFDVYMGLEAAAERLVVYSPDAVIGLLQTPDYARVLTLGVYPDATPEEIAQRVHMRMRRQSLITRRRGAAELGVVLGEAAIRRVVGGPRVMAAQLRRLADMSTMPNVSLRILPFSAGMPLGVAFNRFILLRFGNDAKGHPMEPPIVYLEHSTGGMYLEKPNDVRHYTEAYQVMEQAALDERASRDLCRRVAREFAA
ncbi:XRE family transcriptional regulator [Nocardia nova]|uniref:XRE family transcriptional regulator n=1 Tax=Nocardia nova TaxID=37330 RepID=A0A2S6APF1_9NOCA|nr:helix-turn-helix transcriptional regulator [Nocardia nova]PPJ29017.1 XRE family transcriptional regulator [Nocardia nova]PPJ37082.1 XRE family transcriptional regulator [Nocardia nova]